MRPDDPGLDAGAGRRLSVGQRLELMAAVCDGIQHAHQKAVLHRDVKPSNVLVAEEDRRPVPQVIDFGIAKGLDGALADETLTVGQLIGTPMWRCSATSAGRKMSAGRRRCCQAEDIVGKMGFMLNKWRCQGSVAMQQIPGRVRVGPRSSAAGRKACLKGGEA